MQNAPIRMNDSGTRTDTCAESVQVCSLIVLAQHLVRLKPSAPPLTRNLLTILEWQCRNFERAPAAMRPRIEWTIAKIEEKSALVNAET